MESLEFLSGFVLNQNMLHIAFGGCCGGNAIVDTLMLRSIRAYKVLILESAFILAE